MNFNMIDSPLELKNTPRNLSYKTNSIKHLEELNEDYIPDEVDEVPNTINGYCNLTQGASTNTRDKISSPVRNAKRNSTFAQLLNPSTPTRQGLRGNQKHQTTLSFLQIKLKRLNSLQQQSSIMSLQNIENNSSNEGQIEKSSNTHLSSPTNNIIASSCSSQFKKQQQQIKSNNYFTEYYQNTIIEYID